MPLRADVESLRDATVASLTAAHDHFVYTRKAEDMTPQGVDALVDNYAKGTQVTDLIFNPNASRAGFPTRV